MKPVVLLLLSLVSKISTATSNVLTATANSKDTIPTVWFFDLDTAIAEQQLSYHEQLITFVFEGLLNRPSASSETAATAPKIMFNAGQLNFDWPGADNYWRQWLTEQQRLNFRNISSNTLCGLISEADPTSAINEKNNINARADNVILGTVLYDPLNGKENWTLPIATTIASQQHLLPVTAELLAKHDCLAQLPVKFNLTNVEEMAQEATAWPWAFEHLLPQVCLCVVGAFD